MAPLLLLTTMVTVTAGVTACSSDTGDDTAQASTPFTLPTSAPSTLASQPVDTSALDKIITDTFANQARTAGNPNSIAGVYGPTPKVVGENFVMYGATMTPTEQDQFNARTPMSQMVNANAIAYVGRAATPTGPAPTPRPGPYNGLIWCQSAQLDGANPGTYCLWSDGTHYVAVAQSSASTNDVANLTSSIVTELATPPKAATSAS